MSDTATSTAWATRIIGSGTVRADALIPNEHNWRSHGAGQQAALSSVLAEIGWVAQVVVNVRGSKAWGEQRGRQTLVDGHLRAELALRQGPETELPVTFVDLDPDEESTVLASLDPIGAMATADREKLSELLSGIENPDLAELLDSVARANRIALDFGSTGLTDPDDIPEPPEVPITTPGTLWHLGAHRLMCGDSTRRDDVQRLMAGERAVGMFTDPPYLVDYDGGNHPQTWGRDGKSITPKQKTRHWDAYTDHDSAVTFYRDFLAAAITEALTDRPAIYQWFGAMRTDIVMDAWRANELLCHQILVWHKSRPVLGRCWFMWDYEPCMVGWIQGSQPKLKPPADARAVWDIDQREGIEEGAGNVHPTMKPVEVIRRPIEWHTRPGELIYEPFSGSGTALIAAEMTGRRCYAMELSPVFVDCAVTRWEHFTGNQARKAE